MPTGRGLQAAAYWQATPNWKKRRFRNLLIFNNFHRGTHLGCITWFRDSWAVSRLLGPKWRGGESRDFVAGDDAKRRKSRDTWAKTTKARQLSLTGLVGIETGCGTRLSGGGHEDSQRFSLIPGDSADVVVTEASCLARQATEPPNL